MAPALSQCGASVLNQMLRLHPLLPSGMRSLDQQLRRHCRGPCPADHHCGSEGQNDYSRDGPNTIGPNGDSYKGGEEEYAGRH